MGEVEHWVPEELRRLAEVPQGNFIALLLEDGRDPHPLDAQFARSLLTYREMEKGWERIVDLGIPPVELYWFLEEELQTRFRFHRSKGMTDDEWDKHVDKIVAQSKKLVPLLQGTPFDDVIDKVSLSAVLEYIARNPDELLNKFEETDYRAQLKTPKGKEALLKHMVLFLDAYFQHYEANNEKPLIGKIVRSLFGSRAIDAKKINNILQNNSLGSHQK